MQKCRRGKGTMFVPSLRRSQLSWPGKRMEQVMPDNPALTKWFKSPLVGVVSLRVLKQISYKASLSKAKEKSEFSTSWCTESVQLYGSTTVSLTFGEPM